MSGKVGIVAGAAALALVFFLVRNRRPAPAPVSAEEFVTKLTKRDIGKISQLSKILLENLDSENLTKNLILKISEILGFTNQKPSREVLAELADSTVEVSEKFPGLRLEAAEMLLEICRDKTRKGFVMPQRVIDYVNRVLTDNLVTAALAQRICKIVFFMSAHADNRGRIPVRALLLCLERHAGSSGVVIDALNSLAAVGPACGSTPELEEAQAAVLGLFEHKSLEVQWRALMAFHALRTPRAREVWEARGMTAKVFENLKKNEGRSKPLVEWSLKNFIDLEISTLSKMELIWKVAKTPELAAYARLLENKK